MQSRWQGSMNFLTSQEAGLPEVGAIYMSNSCPILPDTSSYLRWTYPWGGGVCWGSWASLNSSLPPPCQMCTRKDKRPPGLESLVLAILRICWVAFPHSKTYDIIPTPLRLPLRCLWVFCGFQGGWNAGGCCGFLTRCGSECPVCPELLSHPRERVRRGALAVTGRDEWLFGGC